jgi:hypothetical protein
MRGWAEGYSIGSAAGSKIRRSIDMQAARDFQERQFQAVEAHRRFTERLQLEQLNLQKKAQDNGLMQQIHGIVTNSGLHPKQKEFLIDDVARQMGQDPNGERFKGFRRMVTTLTTDQGRALVNALQEMYRNSEPGAIAKVVTSAIEGGITPTQIFTMVKESEERRMAKMAADADAGVSSGQPGALPAAPGGPGGMTDTFSGALAPDGAPSGVAPAEVGASDDYQSYPTDFSGEKGDLGGDPTGTLTAPSPAQPGMAGQLSQMRATMDEEGGVPPGGPPTPETLGQMLGYYPKSQPEAEAEAGPMPVSPQMAPEPVAPAPQAAAPAAAPAAVPPVQAAVPEGAAAPQRTSQDWLNDAARLDAEAEKAIRNRGTGENFRKQADNARQQAKALSEIEARTAALPRDPKKQAAGIAAMLQDAMDAPLEFGKRATERALGPWSATVENTGSFGSTITAVLGFLPQAFVRSKAEIEAMIEGGATPTEVRDRIEAKNDRIAMVMKPFVRQPGEGPWTDRDQAFLIKLLSGVSRSYGDIDEYERRLVDVKDYIEHTLGFGLPMPGPRAIDMPDTVVPWPEMVHRKGQSAADWFAEQVKQGRRNVPPMIRRNQPTR